METCQFLSRNTLKVAMVLLIALGVLALVMCAGYAYSDSSEFCGALCHSMDLSNTTWLESNHKQFKCTECHLPQDGMAKKLVAKGSTGISAVYHETLRDYPAYIEITAGGKAIAEENCLRCHQSTVEKTLMANGQGKCIKCHRGLVHSIDQSKGGIKVE